MVLNNRHIAFWSSIITNILYFVWVTKYGFDFHFKNATVIDKANNQTRKILESWYTAKTAHADNNSFNLPGVRLA